MEFIRARKKEVGNSYLKFNLDSNENIKLINFGIEAFKVSNINFYSYNENNIN